MRGYATLQIKVGVAIATNIGSGSHQLLQVCRRIDRFDPHGCKHQVGSGLRIYQETDIVGIKSTCY
jgi:hypothetical protein